MSKQNMEYEFPPELMDTSRVTERGSTYRSHHSRSKTNSVQFSNTSYISPTKNSSNAFSRLTVCQKPIFDDRQQRKTVAVDDEIESRTKPKVPMYREIEVRQPCRIQLNYKKIEMKESKLLSSNLEGRTWEYGQLKARQQLLVPILKSRPLETIREEGMKMSSYGRQSGESIDSEQYVRSNPSTDISQE